MTDVTRTDYRSLYDKDYIGAWDLQTEDMVITIVKVIGGALTAPGGRKSRKPVVYFKGSEKGFACNATNGKTIASLYGNHVEGWVGKSISLYKSMTRNPQDGGEVECIRVRAQAPSRSAAPQVPPPSSVASATTPADAADLITLDDAMTLAADLRACDPLAEAAFLKIAKIAKLTELQALDLPEANEWVKRRKEKRGAK